MKFLDLFNPIIKGNYGLTEEFIYKSINNGTAMIPLWGGNKNHSVVERMVAENAKTKSGSPINIFNSEGIIISLDGSAGSMTYKKNERFALNHHAGFFTVKEAAKDVILPQFFALFYQEKLKGLSISEGSKTLSLEQIYKEDFEIISFNKQQTLMEKIEPIIEKLHFLEKLLDIVSKLKERELITNYKEYQVTNIPIHKVIEKISGNSGLTEEYIYETLQKDGQKYIVLSSATEDRTKMGYIPKCKINDKEMNVFENKEGLLVTRNGKAGETRYLSPDYYTINDHAYILYVKDNIPYKIDLRWLAIQYKKEFLSFSSSSDNGTWNMTGFFKKVIIDIPSINEQINIAELWLKIVEYEEKLKQILDIFNIIIKRQIAC